MERVSATKWELRATRRMQKNNCMLEEIASASCSPIGNPTSQLVHTPRLGTFSFVLYFTFAMHRWMLLG